MVAIWVDAPGEWTSGRAFGRQNVAAPLDHHIAIDWSCEQNRRSSCEGIGGSSA